MRRIPFAGFIWVRCVFARSRVAGCRRAGRVGRHRTAPRHGGRGAAMTPAGLMISGGPPKRTGGCQRVHRPSCQCLATSVPVSAARAARAAVRQSAGTTQRPAADSRWACGRVSCGAGAGAESKDLGSGLRFLLASRQPVLAVADRAYSMAPVGVQLVKYVLHLLSGTGRPAWGAGCSQRNRRGLGAGRPPRLWPPNGCPERNRGHRRHKDNGQRDIRCHHVLHNALPQLRTAVAAVLPCRLDRSARRIRRYGQRRRAASAWQMSVHRPVRLRRTGRSQGQAFAPGPEIAPAEPGWPGTIRSAGHGSAPWPGPRPGPAGRPTFPPSRRAYAGSPACRRGCASSPGQRPSRDAGRGRCGLSWQALLRRRRR
jgi:hypothetical protein